ncbi:MAG: hypothetical protein IT371_09270 [Deltaproteobacteria bacterium]|nr:hypothetical protein [Deltaproteobacteria bacterium]
MGNHYGKGLAAIDVLFQTSRDGRTWEPVERERPVVYHGGVSEAAIAFDGSGTLWVVTRNEDGDASGFGSHLCRAAPARLARWSCPTTADPERYDSPQLFEHEGEVYLLARRDVGGPFDQGRRELPLLDRRSRNIVQYSLRPKRTALYVLDRRAQKVVHLADLPSAGDTAYPAVVRSGPHRFLIANYSSPLADPERSWIRGQLSDEGTQIYLMELRFVRR